MVKYDTFSTISCMPNRFSLMPWNSSLPLSYARVNVKARAAACCNKQSNGIKLRLPSCLLSFYSRPRSLGIPTVIAFMNILLYFITFYLILPTSLCTLHSNYIFW